MMTWIMASASASSVPGRTCSHTAACSAILVRRAYLDLAEGALPAARRCLELALALRLAQGDRRGMGLVLAGIGLIDTTSGDHDTADRHLAEARDIFRRAGDRWALAATLFTVIAPPGGLACAALSSKFETTPSISSASRSSGGISGE